MIFFPAIDLKDGQCVRLYQGDMERVTVFGDDPAAQARGFAEKGAKWLHVVDLNGAVSGRPVNGDAVEAILAAIDIPVELGGGIRDAATIDQWLDKGIRRVILGTAALNDPDLVRDACKRHPGRIAVGIDARGVDKGFVIVGSPDEVAQQLREVATDLNVGHLMLLLQFGNMGRQLTMHNSELFIKCVKPQLGDLFDDQWEDRWWPRPLAAEQRVGPRPVAQIQ